LAQLVKLLSCDWKVMGCFSAPGCPFSVIKRANRKIFVPVFPLKYCIRLAAIPNISPHWWAFHVVSLFVYIYCFCKKKIDKLLYTYLTWLYIARKLLLTHLVWLRNTCKRQKCSSAVNCRIMKLTAVNYRGKLRQ